MTNPAPNLYTPDMVPVEVPLSAEEITSQSKKDYSSLFMITGIIVFVIIIFIEAMYLVRNGTFDSRSNASSLQGPTLQQ